MLCFIPSGLLTKAFSHRSVPLIERFTKEIHPRDLLVVPKFCAFITKISEPFAHGSLLSPSSEDHVIVAMK